MEKKAEISELKAFVRKILVLDAGLLLVAGVVSLSINLSFGIVLFVLGVLSAVIGASLGRADPYSIKNPAMQQLHPLEGSSARKLSAQLAYNIKMAVPDLAFENVLLLAGLIAVLISLPFLCQIMF